MKKLFIAAIAVMSFGLANAQESGFKAGVHLGMPIGDVADVTSFNFGVDATYMFDVADSFKAGLTAGYSILTAKEFNGIKGENTNFATVGAALQYSFTESIFGGADFGYAIPNEGDGAFYYLPKVGYQTEQFEVYLGYRGIATEGTAITTVQLGFNYKF